MEARQRAIPSPTPTLPLRLPGQEPRPKVLSSSSSSRNRGLNRGILLGLRVRRNAFPSSQSGKLTGLDLFARDARRPSLVRVAAKAYRNVVLTEPGEYTATLTYYNGSTTVATWLVRDIPPHRRAKNLILFVGDGMTTNMITGGSCCYFVSRKKLH